MQMIEAESQGDEISLFALGTMLLRHRWRIARWMLIGAVLAAVSVITKPALYRASASFVPQSNDMGRSSLASLAGQFGVTLPSSANQSLSPEFYAKLLKSNIVLRPIVRDTFTISSAGGRRASFMRLFNIEGESQARREEKAIALLEDMITITSDKTTGVMEFSVATEWPAVSLAITQDLLDGVNNYNARTTKSQASAERRFVEGRLTLASADLRRAEDRLEEFLRSNRMMGSSPELMLERERIQRELGFRQQVFTGLTQSYEDARIREVRDTPVITVFEPPSVPTLPESRGRLKGVLIGLLLGGFCGTLLVFMTGMIDRNRNKGDVAADEFFHTLRSLKGGMFRRRQRENTSIERSA